MRSRAPSRRLVGLAVLLAAALAPLTPATDEPATAASVEQTEQGKREAAELVESFDGLGEGFVGPQGTATLRNPSDNSLAVGPDHVVQTVNSKMAVFTRKGKKFDTTGKA